MELPDPPQWENKLADNHDAMVNFFKFLLLLVFSFSLLYLLLTLCVCVCFFAFFSDKVRLVYKKCGSMFFLCE